MLHNNLISVCSQIQSRGRILSLEHPVVMGILNATPDSFYNKGRDSNIDGLLQTADKMLVEGAIILDIGGASTKPGQPIISSVEELQRVIPVIGALRSRFPDVWLSVDTYNSSVAHEAVMAGADIVNDVSGARIDNEMLQVVAKLGVPYIAMHMQGTPQTMQVDPRYEDAAAEVRNYLFDLNEQCIAAGIKDVILDPGFGFGKTLEHNYQLLRTMHTLRMAGRPILAGISRKSIVCKVLQVDPENALNGTTALHMLALQQGASILRVHDVKEARQCIRLFELYNDTAAFN